MKTLTTTLILLLCVLVKAQEYYPFPTDSATWSISTSKYLAWGDTIIGSKEYKKVYWQTDSVEFEFDINKAQYFAAIRNDTANKAVYGVYHKADTVFGYLSYPRINIFDHFPWSAMHSYPKFFNCDTCELLLYTFNLSNISDSVKFYTFPFKWYDRFHQSVFISDNNKITEHTITSFTTSTQSINGTDRLQYLINCKLIINGSDRGTWVGKWIEGIGSKCGLFHSLHTIEGTFEGNTELLCLEYKNDYIYKKDSVCYRSTRSGIGSIEENNKLNYFTVYPNPIYDNFIFIENKIENYSWHELHIQLFDVLGKKVFDKKIPNDNHPIYIGELMKGAYIYKVADPKNNFISNGKIIIL